MSQGSNDHPGRVGAASAADCLGPDADDEEYIRIVGPRPYRPEEARRANGVTVSREALEAYQAANDRFWGFLHGIQRELAQTSGPCCIERLSQLLRRKLVEMDQAALDWQRDKYAVGA
jgi:hypothetical protein